MSGAPHLAPAGSSRYSSQTLHVGDGTWDASRDTFLLPNIQGVNFATMRYNGMGNRFRELHEYHTLITGHGTLAAITFMGVVPVSILIASFYHRNPRLALRTHISLQILTVLLSTVVLVLGYFAVGPERSLTNPHHGIGVAIYVLVMIQAIGGWVIHKIEKGKMRYHIPIKLMLHQWLGRGIALLALAQIPIGLTLYGSPLVLFILYAVAIFTMIILYFVLTYQSKKRAAAGYDQRGSYITGTQTETTDNQRDSRRRGTLSALTGGLLGGAGLAALRKRKSERRAVDPNSEVGSRPESDSYMTEKYTGGNGQGKENSWRNRLFGGAAGLGAFAGLREIFGRNTDRMTESDLSGSYMPRLGERRDTSATRSAVHVNRMEEGLPASSANQPPWDTHRQDVRQGPGVPVPVLNLRRSQGSIGTDFSQRTAENSRTGWFARLAASTGLRKLFQSRREREEQASIDDEHQREYENERIYGTRDDQPINSMGSTATPMRDGVRFDAAAIGPMNVNHPGDRANIPPIPANLSRPSNYGVGSTQQPQPSAPPPPNGPPRSNARAAGRQAVNMPSPINQESARAPGPAAFPPPTNRSSVRPKTSNAAGNTANYDALNVESNRTEAVTGSSVPETAAAVATDNDRSLSGDLGRNVNSPPVSVKVNMSNGGRRVTVRRLNQDEVSSERDNSRTGARNQSNDIDSSPQGRRVGSAGATGASENIPGNVASEGYDTGTDSYDTNRRRRRAERARAEQARQESREGGGVGRVDFS